MAPEMRFEVELGRRRSEVPRDRKGSTRILILGDLIGARASESQPPDGRKVALIDLDNFSEVFARFRPSVALPALGLQAPLEFGSLDDFHPDSLFARVELLDRFRALRQRLQNPSTFKAAADELRSGGATLLGRPLGAGGSPAPRQATNEQNTQTDAGTGIEGFVRSLVASHMTVGDDPQLPQLLSAVDVAVTDTMRRLLHDPAFQRLEATWRSIQWLLTRIGEFDEGGLEVGLLHLTREELDPLAEPDSALERTLEAGRVDDDPWSLVVVDISFGPPPRDLETLTRLVGLAGRTRTPLVAAASGALIGCTDESAHADPTTWTDLPAGLARLWSEMSEPPDRRTLALTWPRLLLRLPYGKKTDPIDGFAFEEIPPAHDHEDYLWGNGAFAAALTLAQTVRGSSDGIPGDIDDLPAFTYVDDGEPVLKPCAEFCMTERTATEVRARGVMPLVSYQNRNAVRLVGLPSLWKYPSV